MNLISIGNSKSWARRPCLQSKSLPPSNNRLRSVAAILLIAVCLIALPGCGGAKEWPSSEGDYSKVQAGRGLAMMWGVIIDIEKAEGTQINITQSGNIGEVAEDTFAEKVLQLGDVTIKLSVEGTEKIQLTVNGKSYGNVRISNRVKITEERDVLVNNQKRDSK